LKIWNAVRPGRTATGGFRKLFIFAAAEPRFCGADPGEKKKNGPFQSRRGFPPSKGPQRGGREHFFPCGQEDREPGEKHFEARPMKRGRRCKGRQGRPRGAKPRGKGGGGKGGILASHRKKRNKARFQRGKSRGSRGNFQHPPGPIGALGAGEGGQGGVFWEPKGPGFFAGDPPRTKATGAPKMEKN